MRSFTLIFCTAAALFAAFLVYTRISAPPRHSAESDMTASAPASQPAMENQPYAAGAWSNLYDKDGVLYGRLRSRVCVPRPDGQWHLTDPEAEFYQNDGQIIHLTAADGDVVLGQQTHRQDLMSGPVDPPSQGTLRDVTVTLYPSADAFDRGDADLTIHMKNTHFDADTYRLYTVAERDAAGKVTAADLIPVQVAGRELDFDGSGLLLDWDGQAHELKSLSIAHGRRLELRSAAPEKSSKEAGNQKTAGTGSAASKPAETAAVHVYLAVFNGGVRVMQNNQERIVAERMAVTMTTGHSGQGAGRGGGSDAGAPGGGGAGGASDSAPVDVYWGGTLRIVPADATVAMQPGQAIVHFTGRAVQVHEESVSIVGSDVQYDSATGEASAVGSAAEPLQVTLLNHDGGVAGRVFAERAVYLAQKQHVVFPGAGTGRFADPAKPNDAMRIGWSQACDLTLSGTGNALQIQHARLLGDASVTDGPEAGPAKLHLTAGRIDTDFAASPAGGAAVGATGAATIRDLIATGDAHCVIHDENAADRSLSSDVLTVEMGRDSDGKPYPHFITAEGNVHGRQEQEELWSRRLDATVAPAAAGDDPSHFSLRTMLASGDVRFRNGSGDVGSGDTLSVEEHANHPLVTLVGNPYASVTDADRTLKGAKIELKPDENWAAVVGPGLIDGLASAPAGDGGQAASAQQPMHARWTGSATVLGAKNQIDIVGGVRADSTEASGAKNAASADDAILFLTPKAAAGGDNKPATGQFDLLKDKQVQVVSLRKNASVSSTLLAADHSILRRMFIEGARIDSDVILQTLSVPGPGRMLLEEHKKKAVENNPAGGQGISAFSWTKSFLFDQAKHQAVIDGSVQIKNQPDGPHAGPTELVADHVTADFAPQAGGGEDAPLKLTQMTAAGHVLVQDGNQLIQTRLVTFDPITETLTAIGMADDPVRVTDLKTGGEETFERASINTRTHQFSATNLSGHGSR